VCRRAILVLAEHERPETTFVLSNAGHLQSLLNPPGNPKASFEAGLAKLSNTDAFAATAEKHAGSWWPHWSAWLSTRSGEKVLAPSRLGNEEFTPGEAAPGTYVFNA
jgi:polyhydroxyalkanoate synthase